MAKHNKGERGGSFFFRIDVGDSVDQIETGAFSPGLTSKTKLVQYTPVTRDG